MTSLDGSARASGRLRRMSGEAKVSRRAVLGMTVAAVAAGATGCRHRASAGSGPSSPDPDAAAVDAARHGEQELIDAYQSVTPADAPPDDARIMVRQVHEQHLRALGGTPAPTTATPAPRPVRAARALAVLERRSSTRLRSAADVAVSGDTAALLASVAASHSILSAYRQVG